jgi:cystathionine gamma-synthase
MKFETRAVHAGHRIDPATGSVAPPIYLSTTYARDPEGTPLGGHTYIRESNPTQEHLEEALAHLEGGEGALVFASGMAAGVALLQTLPPGSHVLFPDDAYYGFRAAAQEFLPNWGIRSSFVAMDDLAALEAAIRPETRLVWLETPSNPLLQVVDLAAAAALARRDETYERVHHLRHVLGPVASPFNCWLVLRGVRTLACRVAAQSAGALAVAQALEASKAVSAVHYPGLPSHPGHEIARRQMSAFGAMLSFRAAGGREAALAAVARARLFTRATSLGGVESLMEHRASSEGPASRTPQDLIRLSIGLEHPDDLAADLLQALEGA